MSKIKEKTEKPMEEEKVIEVPVTKDVNKTPVVQDVKINLEAFASQVGLPWQTKSRLEYYIAANKLPMDNTIDEWKAIVKKV